MNFKNGITTFGIMLLSLGAVFTFVSCEDDPCEDVTCVNGTPTESNGSCSCDCDAGYEGTDCSTVSRDKFIGTYNISDDCLTSGYSNSVSAGSSIDKVVFSNLGNFSTAAVVVATVDGNSLEVSGFTDGAGRDWTASGTLSGSTLTLTYTVTYSDGTSETCTITGTLQ